MMREVDPRNLAERENYKFLIGSVLPRPIALVSSLSDQGILNLAPFSFFNVVSSDPPRISLAIQRRAGERKDTARNILANKHFAVHMVSEEILHAVNQTAATLDYEDSELDLTNFSLVENTVIDVPGIKDAKIRYECVLDEALTFKNDEGALTTDLIIGEIVKFHIEDDLYENGRIDTLGLNPMSRLVGSDYGAIGEIRTIERPK